jgi:peptide/nickel transport system substrate-binding protein
LLVLALLLGCASPTQTGGEAGAPAAPGSSKTLVISTRTEPATLAGTVLHAAGIGAQGVRRPFNAAPALKDGEGRHVPYLAESLPQLNSDSWRVHPDGTMQTTYRLKPGLTWHDGAPLDAQDFVFAWRIYTSAEFGTANWPPHHLMSEVTAPDSATVVIEWRAPYAGAGTLEGRGGAGSLPGFTPLPRHLLEQSFLTDRAGFSNLPFWTTDYVGVGPFKLERWESGAFIEGVAFPGHALGRPRVERLRFVFTADPNAVLAMFLSGDVHVPIDSPISIEQGQILKREWDARDAGTVQFLPSTGRYIRVQHRPEYANPRAILDLRVRQAVASTIDKAAINEGILYGLALISDTMAPGVMQANPELARSVPIYAYDVRRADQLMVEAGYARDRDGMWMGSEGRLDFEVKNISSDRNDTERAILADTWRRFGLDMREAAYTAALARDGQALSTFRSLSPTGGTATEDILAHFTSTTIPTPENRWVGNNRGGWMNPEYDRRLATLSTTLDRSERARSIAQALTVLNDDVAVIPLYLAPAVFAYPADLHGITAGGIEADTDWNIYEWQFSTARIHEPRGPQPLGPRTRHTPRIGPTS